MPLPSLQSPERRRALGLLAGLAVAGASHAQAAFDLPQLMRLLAQVKAGTAIFTETRHVAMLERPLESSGRLAFEAPDTFVRETLKPRHERIAIAGNNITLSQGARSRTMALDAAPEAAILVDAIRGVLSGNGEAIEKKFTTSVTGDPARWILELLPRDARQRERLTSVRISGRQSAVLEVAVAMADGDRSVMKIEPQTNAADPAPPARPAN